MQKFLKIALFMAAGLLAYIIPVTLKNQKANGSKFFTEFFNNFKK